MAKIKISGWNYVPVGQIDTAQAVEDWHELGLNYPMSFYFNPKQHDKNEFIKCLDECHKKGMKVFIDDYRTDFRTLEKVGEEEYRKGVRQAVEDFGSHPATYGFHIGDEPDVHTEEIAIKAIQVCNEYAPNLTHFINLLPYWADDPDGFYEATGARTADEYGERVSNFIRRSGIKLISYDCYAQCCYFDKEFFQGVYFENLRIFQKAAKENGVELYTSLLSVGHWSLRVPTEDDIRWQISTAIASGCVGLVWFFIYERGLDGSFRNPPIDLFWKKTAVYEYLSRQDNTFLTYYADRFSEYNFVWAKHFGTTYGGYEEFEVDENIKEIDFSINPSPLLISKFKNAEGKTMLVVVNLNRTEPTCPKIQFGERFNNRKFNRWFAPGQMRVFMSDK